ncbi:MAG: DUF4136 domain-containing protein [Acidobacteriaceae bacterium]
MRKFSCRRSIFSFALAVTALLALPAILQAQSVRVNWSKNVSFAGDKTYAWIPSKDSKNPFYRQYVGEYVNLYMKKKGMERVSASQSPALLVTYHFMTQETEDLQTNGYGYGGGGWGGMGMGMGDGMGMGMGMGGMGINESTTTEVPVTMGILTVDMIDAKTKKIIWRGQASADNVNTSTKGEEKDVQKSVEKMLDHFPPK